MRCSLTNLTEKPWHMGSSVESSDLRTGRVQATCRLYANRGAFFESDLNCSILMITRLLRGWKYCEPLVPWLALSTVREHTSPFV